MATYLLLITLCFLSGSIAISIEESSVRTEGLQAPSGISTLTPRLSWRLSSDIRGDSQSAYQIQVASTISKLTSTPDFWDSGKVLSSDFNALYVGTVLKSRDLAWWRVRAYDAVGIASPWSDITMFEIGLLAISDWKGSWITNANYATGVNSLPMFAKDFSVECPLMAARLYIVGLGLHAAQINGKDVTTNVLAPGYNSYSRTLAYDTFNVTSLLEQGTNIVGVELGKGPYDAEASPGRYMKWTTSPQQLRFIAQLEFTCINGSTFTTASDETWKSTLTGPRTEASWFGGEDYDATKAILNWSTSSGNRTDWDGVSKTNSPGGILVGPSGPGLAIVQTINSISVTTSGPSFVFDFGVNFAGIYALDIAGCSAGTRIVVWPSERLTRKGLADQSTTGDPIFDGYTCNGDSSQLMKPKFVYHGFRYLQIDGLPNKPTVDDMKGHIIRQNVDAVGSVETSSSLFNNIYSITDRAIQSNSYSVLTDCPHREKLGWLEETHLVFDAVTRGYDIQSWSKDIVRMISDSQQSNGLIPDIAPEFVVFSGGFRDDPNWGSAGVLLPLKLYQTYGEVEVLGTYYPMMKRYVAYLTSKTGGTYLLSYGLGDWVTFDKCTPIGVTATFGYQQAVNAMITIATALGKTGDATEYMALESNIKKAFHAKYFIRNTNSSYSCGSQAANAIALDMGAVPAANQAAVISTLVNSLTSNANHLTVGEIALPSLFRSLQAAGRDDILFDMMSLTTNVSYGFQVVNGATSLWEKWDGVTGGGSLNHFMLGYANLWLSSLSGIKQAATSTAWRTIDLFPLIVGDLTSARASYRTPNGVVSASWSRTATEVIYDVVIPIGSTANIRLNGTKVTEGGESLSGRPGVISVTTDLSITSIKVGSGSYNFTVIY